MESPCLEPGGPFLFFFFCMNGRRKQLCHLVGPPFQAPMTIFCARAGWYSPREYSLVSGRGQVRELTWDGWLNLCVQFGA